MLRPIRVLIVDDSAFFRKALAAEISKHPKFEVIGTAANGRSAIAQTKELKPDVVTLDIEMPVLGGLEALRAIVALGSSSVIMVSAQTERGAQVTMEALEAGAVDFIPKTRGELFIHEKLQAAADVAVLNRARKRRSADSSVEWSNSTPVKQPVTVRRDAEIVVVGSSTGGPQALLTMLSSITRPLPVPMVIAQHMPPHFTEALAKRLALNSALKIQHACNGDKLTPGHVYIAPGGSTMRVREGEIAISDEGAANLYKPSVDVLVASAIASYGKKVLGVLLTGMGADGAKEMTKLHKIGGYNLAQDQATCVVYGMPRSLVEFGGADEILPLAEIGPRLATILAASLASTSNRVAMPAR